MKRIVLASHNTGKIKELNQLLEPYHFEVLSQGAFNLEPIEETGLTFIENALLKARNAAQQTGCIVLADDSGLSVDALNGEPGIYSARYSGTHATDEMNNQHLLKKLIGLSSEQRTARFHSVIVLMNDAQDPVPSICHGIWEGVILESAQGENGFGYDPLFYIPELNCTAAELTAQMKNQVSHRAKAMQQLISVLRQQSSSKV